MNNELDSSVTAFHRDVKSGSLTEVQTLSTLPGDFKGTNSTAEIFISPGGKHLYVSNRGHNSIVVYEIDQTTGRLKYVEHESTGGEIPRNFNITPDGGHILACNQKSGTIVLLKVDKQTGRLSSTGVQLEIPTPVCVIFDRIGN